MTMNACTVMDDENTLRNPDNEHCTVLDEGNTLRDTDREDEAGRETDGSANCLDTEKLLMQHYFFKKICSKSKTDILIL
ncbi:hypothetical protein NPIL_621751 [Nephila pilipes]|uniref:Uncharacterized protein n=1 Tax=Nephila pilipes TaxID=299642 RepID=A0A8X6R1D5_NEPPI|nr:hypothetical protein NPIL_621751 [Nephila pilipes]